MGSNSLYLNKLKDKPFIEIFNLSEAGENIFDNYQRYDFYQVIWFTNVTGNSSYFLDFKEYTIKEDQVVVIFPGQLDRLDIQGKEGYLFAIHTENFFHINQRINSPYLNGYLSNIFVSIESIKNTLEQLFLLLKRENENQKRILLMECYMEAFLFHVSSLVDNNNKLSINDSQVAELMRIIDCCFIHERETEFYAVRMGMSCKKLNEMVIKGTGKTVKQHLQERLILEIKKEIRLNEKSLKEIAFSLGFNEPAYFTRFFKQHTGITPTDFKNKAEW